MKIGIIGCGNMGSALAHAITKSKLNIELYLSDFIKEKADELASVTGGVSCDNETVAKADIILLGVKPQMMGDMLISLQKTLKERTERFLLISMAAGLTTKTLLAMAGGDYPIFRIMPNTPCSIGEGMILYTGVLTTEQDTETFLDIFNGAGKLLYIPEKQMDAGSAISGCGPAFAAMFIDALADGGVCAGLSRSDALLLAAKTVAGTANLILETHVHPGQLKDAVCSPAGSTIAGVEALEKHAFRRATSEAVKASYHRTKELGKD